MCRCVYSQYFIVKLVRSGPFKDCVDICVRATNRKYIYIIHCVISSRERLMTATAAFRLNVYIVYYICTFSCRQNVIILLCFLFDRIFNVILHIWL